MDMAVWHWMYDHPQATPKELNDATVQISKNIWNQYYAPVFHKKDVVLLGIYSHMIDSFLYLPDYPIGHMIAFQIEEQMKKAGSIGPEFERMAKMGDVTPDLWMVHATGPTCGAGSFAGSDASRVGCGWESLASPRCERFHCHLEPWTRLPVHSRSRKLCC